MASILDIAHIVFLESISEAIINTGAAAAKGNLMRRAEDIAGQLPGAEYDSLEAWEAAVKAQENPITRIEGPSIRDGSIFIMPRCPFATSIKTYKDLFQQLPGEYSLMVEEFNKPGRYTRELMVGYGSGVSPFCAIHQTLRSAAGKKIKVGNKNIRVIQLGCKAADGKKAISDELCKIAGVERETVDKYLDNGMCVYKVKVLDE